MIDYVLVPNVRLGSPGSSELLVDSGANGSLILLLLSARMDARVRCAVVALVSRKSDVIGALFGGSGVPGADGRLTFRRVRMYRGDRQVLGERVVQAGCSFRKDVAAVVGSI